MTGPGDHRDDAPSHIHIEKKKGVNWLPWLLLALGVLALLVALSRCGRNEATVGPAAAPSCGLLHRARDVTVTCFESAPPARWHTGPHADFW